MNSLETLFNRINDLENKKFEDKLVCFIDILGSKKQILASQNPMDIALPNMLINHMKDASVEYKKNLHIALFSDCAYIITDKENANAMIEYLSILTLHLLTDSTITNSLFRHALLRGGISYGSVYYDEKIDFIVGPAMINAYLLEQEAIYPRIIVDEKAIEVLQDMTMTHTIIHEGVIAYINWIGVLNLDKKQRFPNVN